METRYDIVNGEDPKLTDEQWEHLIWLYKTAKTKLVIKLVSSEDECPASKKYAIQMFVTDEHEDRLWCISIFMNPMDRIVPSMSIGARPIIQGLDNKSSAKPTLNAEMAETMFREQSLPDGAYLEQAECLVYHKTPKDLKRLSRLNRRMWANLHRIVGLLEVTTSRQTDNECLKIFSWHRPPVAVTGDLLYRLQGFLVGMDRKYAMLAKELADEMI